MRLRDPEPCSFDGEYVAEWLEAAGRPQSAAFVRYLSNRSRDANQREDFLRSKIDRLARQLEVYEPPAKRVEVNYQPPPEATD